MLAHLIEVRVFCTPEDDKEKVNENLLSFFPFDLNTEKIRLKSKNALGFNEREICIMEVRLEKQRHITAFLKHLAEMLSDEQKQMILEQASSCVDDELNFYMRIDKDKLIHEKKCWLTDSGNCYHIKIVLAAFPRKRANALNVVERIFG